MPSTIDRVSPVQFAGFEELKPGMSGAPPGPVTGTVPLPVVPALDPGVSTFIEVGLGGASLKQPELLNKEEPYPAPFPANV